MNKENILDQTRLGVCCSMDAQHSIDSLELLEENPQQYHSVFAQTVGVSLCVSDL